MSRERIAEQLKKAMGLHAPTVGMRTITSAIDNRMQACNISNDEEYLNRIITSEDELKELIEVAVIPETWFFRENQAYKYILKHLEEKRHHHEHFNILSLPCSTGEEPYTIAMLLLDNDISVDDFTIDAIDISNKNIHKAKQGQYRKNSFRASDLGFMDRYFHEHDNLYNLARYVKHCVNFHCANVLDNAFDMGYKKYDIVLCRNLLIYFDKGTQERVFSILDRLLKDDGLLIIGQAETIQHSNGLFVPAIYTKSYVYVKESNIDKSLPHFQKTRRNKLSSPRKILNKLTRTHRPFSITTNTSAASSRPTNRNDDYSIEQAIKLADKGDLVDALKICEALIRESNAHEAYYLSGIIFSTQGDMSKANEYLQKAVYLDPQNIDALMHLSLIARQLGNNSEADRYKQRADRIRKRLSA